MLSRFIRSLWGQHGVLINPWCPHPERRQRQYDQMRRNYIDNITRELKTPVASIKALTEALFDGMEKKPMTGICTTA